MRRTTAGSPARWWAIGVAVALAGFGSVPASARANTFTATDTASLATAVAGAKSTPGANTIVLAPALYDPTHTVDLTNASGTLTIQGPPPDATTSQQPAQIDASAISPPGTALFKIEAGVTVEFLNVLVVNGGSIGSAPAVDDFGTVSVSGSSIAGNDGTGLFVEPNATATVVNSTLSDGLDFGLIDQGTATLTNTTVVRNADGGIDDAQGSLRLVNTIVAGNGFADCTRRVPAANADHSLDGDGTCGVGALSAKNPKLGPINLSGGPTPTDLPAADSPVIDAGDPAACPAADQRGAARPDDPGTACDLGAVEHYAAPPVLNAPNITTSTADAGGKPVSFTATFTDAGAPIETQSCAPASGSNFTIGTTTVSCTATDSFGNLGAGTFTVRVDQRTTTEPPVIATPGPTAAAATDAHGAIVTFTATATDRVDGTDPVTCTPASGSRFPLGPTTVDCAATDTSGNTGTATFTVTVTDQARPAIAVPADITVAPTSPSGTVVAYSASATDNVDGSDPVTCVPPSGSTFGLGTTTVTCTASDRAGNAASRTFQVKVVADRTPPVITSPGDLSATGTSAAGAKVSFTATAVDNVDGSVAVTCAPPSGTTFPFGATTVTCTSTDTSGNTGSISFTVTVIDLTLPVIAVPADIAAAATGPGGSVVDYTVRASDVPDGPLTPACSPASGSTFPIGTTAVTCSATDKSLNMAMASFEVAVSDVTAPAITVPDDLVAAQAKDDGAAVKYAVSASDDVDGGTPVTCTPASGSTFPVGRTPVACTATDKAGNTATSSFNVTVAPDMALPALKLPADLTTAAPGAAGASVSFTASAKSGIGAAVPVGCAPASGSVFPLGTTRVTCTATNAVGTSSGGFSVTVKPPFGADTTTTGHVSVKGTRAGVVTLSVSCAGPSTEDCRLTLRLLPGSTPAASRRAALASRTVDLAGGEKVTVRLRLNRASLAELKKAHRRRVLLGLSESVNGGASTTLRSRHLVLKA